MAEKPKKKPREPKENETTDTEKPSKKPLWVTRAMAEEFTREEILDTTLKEAALYLFFLTAISIMTLGCRNSKMFYLTEAMRNQFLGKAFESSFMSPVFLTFDKITTADNFWEYTTTLMIDSLYWEYYYEPEDYIQIAQPDDKKILHENLLLGVPRIRQVRVKDKACKIHEKMQSYFKKCLSSYTQLNEDKSDFNMNETTGWVHSSAADTKSITTYGIHATYGAGGYYQDLSTNRQNTTDILDKLKENLWITRSTRAIFINFAVYNGNWNLFCICKLIFEFSPTGGVLPWHSFKTFQMLKMYTTWDYITFIFEVLVYITCIYYIFEEVREMIYFKWLYILDFWTVFDWSIILLIFSNLLMNYVIMPNVGDAIDEIKAHPEKYGNLEYIGFIKDVQNDLQGLLLFLVYVKVFKFLSFNKTMGQLNITMSRCAVDILTFCIMFFIVFCAFAQLGYMIFGNQVEAFKSFGFAMQALLRTILGDFNYQNIREANALIAPIYFVGFIVFVFFVLLNMFLAIIVDTYGGVKTEIAISKDELQMIDYLKIRIFNCLRKLGVQTDKYQSKPDNLNTINQQIRDTFKRCGFNDLEAEMFFAKYNIGPLTDSDTFDFNKVLQELEKEEKDTQKTKVDASAVVYQNDLVPQIERLDQVETIIQKIAARVEALIQRFDSLVQKG